ncbi:peroxide stress protein YaaA [Granulicoccus phenolivorans]|uniref:peroxide stress protein YaaA n=1 Tax=Granulicoccus phenolivorans TaxID=266854 RepID=UPI000404D770|nr:peroxide stress protein YaaA [Granulicoccus phenolivorans]
MLTVLSPAKSLDYESRLPTRKHSEPRLLAESADLIEVMREKSVAEVASLMHISEDLAALNVQRYADFHTPFTTRNARPAALAFHGDVYLGMAPAERFGERDWTEAQKTVRILSGLYGVLRPLDLMQPYRLEMGTRLATPRGKDLYTWWGDRISALLAEDLAASPGAEVLVNLASDEYFRSVRPRVIGVPIIAPRFEDTSESGVRSVISFFAKRARGEMAAWLVLNRVRRVGELTGFDGAGYRYDPASSTRERPVFVRAYADRPALAAPSADD